MTDSRKNSHDFSVYMPDDSDILVTIEAEMLVSDRESASAACLNTLDMKALMNEIDDVITKFVSKNKIVDRSGEKQDG
jgi:cell fate (sporulation/competence/biofilm development) regulator YlbF (YheA/YmcA/DUF963 family)